MLFIITLSPFVKALPPTAANQVLVLTQDAVIAATLPNVIAPYDTVYALTDDLAARGLLSQISSNVTVIDYQQFVELTINNHPIVTWK